MTQNNKTNDLVTIVTVTYNAEDLLEETLLSVINQTYDNIEYIVIDGASSDKTLDIIKQYEDKIDYWVSEPDEGIYYAMNKAIEKANGKWINFMNAGDTFSDDQTVEYVMNHASDKSELLYGDFLIKETGNIRKAWDPSLWDYHMPFCHQTLFAKTDLMKKDPFDTHYRLAADHHFILKMYKNRKRFEYIEKTIAVFSLGGFAESNEFLMNIESLKILLELKVPQDGIIQSDWYKVFQKNLCTEHTLQIESMKKTIEAQEEMRQEEERKLKPLTSLKNDVEALSRYSVWRHPLKKYRSYKKMLSDYAKITK